MRQFRIPRSFKKLPLAIFAALLLAVFARVWLQKKLEQSSDTDWRSQSTDAQELYAKQPPDAGVRADDAMNQALVDSILSIIQSYYVDEDRIDNRHLLDAALYKLTEYPQIKLRTEKESYTLECNGKSLTLSLPEPFTYETLVDHAFQINDFLRRNQTVKPNADGKMEGHINFLAALLSGLDSHSALLDSESYKELRQGTEGAFGGVGLVVGMRDNILTVLKPLPHSPAEKAGLKRADKILKIDDKSTFGSSLDALVDHMRGAPGSKVILTILRAKDEFPQKVAVQREFIQVDSVESNLLRYENKPILHLTVENFASRTAKEIRTAVKETERQQKQKLAGLVLDLRSNPGGLLDQAVEVSDLFLKGGRIVSTIGRREESESALNSEDDFDFPVVVLINNESASASEIVAGALQDNDRAIILGQPSFGKGSVQTIFELPGDQALKLTIARYFTPSGHSIQNVGIMPHIWLQPVYDGKMNENLLGTYRYQSEGFLANHLAIDDKWLRQREFNVPDFKGYYLAEIDKENRKKRHDKELELAQQIIGRVAQKYGVPAMDGTKRAGHWLGVCSDIINKNIAHDEDVVGAYLQKNFKVTWGGARQDRVLTSQNYELKVGKDHFVAAEGSKLKIPFEVVNRSDNAERVSVFVRSNSGQVATQEILLGKLHRQEVRKGELEVPIYSGIPVDSDVLQIGVAADSQPILKSFQRVVLEVSRGAAPKYMASLLLEDEGVGKYPGVLEAKEQARIRVIVKNEGSLRAENVEVRLTNLAGKQIYLVEKPFSIAAINPGEEQSVLVPVGAAKHLFSHDLAIGVEVTSKQWAGSVHEIQNIRAQAATALPRVTKVYETNRSEEASSDAE